ncbi:MAG: preprotein translocase subunit SecE [Patescibacteria group bacterium]|jgi:preprotein translocase subunit SecE
MKKIIQFVKEAVQELRKVVWPTRLRVFRLTVGVILVSAAFALFIGLVDIGITKGIEGLLAWVAERQGTQTSDQGTSPIQIQPGDIQVDTTPAE